MRFVNWALLGVGAISVAGMGFLGIAAYSVTSQKTEFTERDIVTGTSYLPGERDALIAACQGALAEHRAICGCIADRAEDTASRFDRLAMTASFQKDNRAVAGLGWSLSISGLDKDAVARINAGLKTRFDSIIHSCARL